MTQILYDAAAMHDRPIFMLTHGRTGSTWVQRILNIHPHITIWGEHYGFLDGVAKGYFRFMDQYSHDGIAVCDKRAISKLVGPATDAGLETEWFNPFTPDELTDLMRRMVTDLFARPTGGRPIRWGFKEIRYEDKMVPRFLDAMFPNSQAIILRRDPVDMLRSQTFAWQKQLGGRTLDAAELDAFIVRRLGVVGRQERLFRWLEESIPDRVIKLTYEGMVDDFENEVMRLFAFLGEDPGLMDPKALKAVRRTKRSTTPRNDSLVARIQMVSEEWHKLPEKERLGS